MGFEVSDIWVIAAVVGLAVIGFAVFRLRKKTEPRSSGRQFVVMGTIWLLFGLAYSLWRGDNLFDIGLFNLGIIFTIAGLFQLAMERYGRKNQ